MVMLKITMRMRRARMTVKKTLTEKDVIEVVKSVIFLFCGRLVLYFGHIRGSRGRKKESISSSSVSELEESTSEDTSIFEQSSYLKSSLSSLSFDDPNNPESSYSAGSVVLVVLRDGIDVFQLDVVSQVRTTCNFPEACYDVHRTAEIAYSLFRRHDCRSRRT